MTAFVPPASLVASLAKPYVETHWIGRVWLAVVIAAAVVEIVGAGRRRNEATKQDRGSLVVIRLCGIPGILLLIASPKIAPAADIPAPLVSAIVGIVIFSAGEGLRIWSKVALGRYFTYSVMTSSDQPVISSGPYRVLRHPSYSGMLLIAIGAGAAYGNWLGLGALTLLILVGVIYRISVEEKALLAELGDRYRTYADHHRRLIPFVW